MIHKIDEHLSIVLIKGSYYLRIGNPQSNALYFLIGDVIVFSAFAHFVRATPMPLRHSRVNPSKMNMWTTTTGDMYLYYHEEILHMDLLTQFGTITWELSLTHTAFAGKLFNVLA